MLDGLQADPELVGHGSPRLAEPDRGYHRPLLEFDGPFLIMQHQDE